MNKSKIFLIFVADEKNYQSQKGLHTHLFIFLCPKGTVLWTTVLCSDVFLLNGMVTHHREVLFLLGS